MPPKLNRRCGILGTARVFHSVVVLFWRVILCWSDVVPVAQETGERPVLPAHSLDNLVLG